ncbi:MAG: hypothetical protein JWO86_8059 [Myxococcaceae bacterium]|nr:hypothetical protein [Myxococcaceae bacterium]
MPRSPFYTIPAVVITLAACSSTDVPTAPRADAIERTSSAIINGQLDTTHQAVVAVILQQGTEGGLCSGTIVKVDPVSHVGWVLAAAHCVAIQPVYVLQGNDFSQQTSTLQYDILDYKADPRYAGQVGSPYDFAVLRILGVDASTPTIPLVSASDGLAVGTAVESVGYGRTTLIASGTPTTDNTLRRHVAKNLSQVSQSAIAYDMSTDGICQGDSGGPVLVTQGGVQKVAGVHSYVQGDCNGTGVSVRVSFDLSFINGELAKAAPADSCDLCGRIASSGDGTCAELTKSCFTDKDCNGYYQCLQTSPRNVCLMMFPKAEGPFNAAANCQCTRACTTQCKGAASCAGAPKCGYAFPAGTCAACMESACCDEALACAADGTCYVCLKTADKAAECATNAARQKMATCVASKCQTQCAGAGPGTGAAPAASDPGADPAATDTPPASGAAPTSTTTTSGCSVALPASRTSTAGYALFGLALVLASARRGARRAGRSHS